MGERDQASAPGAATGAQGRKDPTVLSRPAKLCSETPPGPLVCQEVDELRRVERVALHLGVHLCLRGRGPVLRVLRQ